MSHLKMRIVNQDPCDDSFVQNPYPAYDDWRAQPWVYWQHYGMAVSAQHAVVQAVMRDRRFGREAPAGFAPEPPAHLKPFYDFESRSMLEREPPTHTRLRSLVLRAFTSRRIEGMAGEISQLAHQLIDAFPARDQAFDLLPALAERVPVTVIARLIGVPDSMATQLLAWSHDMVAMYQARRDRAIEDRAVAATLAFSDFIRSIAAQRRQQPADDLITELLRAEADGDKLSMDELITTVILLLNAGHEATVHAIGNGLHALLTHKLWGSEGAWQETELDAVIEEILRFDPPLHLFTRYCLTDASIEGQHFQRGQQVGLLLAAANRDPSVWPEPHRLDLARPKNAGRSHTSFGAGLHFCLGAPLARLELRACLLALRQRCPQLRLADAPRYANRYHFHGLEQLLVYR
jgi:cytochrome P450